jgi:multiple sugar transport system ATP-binding protein
MARVELKNVQKTYPDGSKAVHDFNLDIADGEFIVLVGPSGCGKSTTLRMVAGLEEVTGGSIVIDGREVNNLHPKDRDIAMVFQNYALYPHMSVYENIAFSLRLRGADRSEIERRVKHAAELLDLTKVLEKKPKGLSGGQRQRVAVGRAIVREPKAFLFDEPLSNLDARLRVTTRAEIKSLQMRLRTTTIYVTHDQEEAMTMGDRIVVMYRGVVQQAGTPMEIYATPANRFVAGFLGTPPMNFVSGLVSSDAAGGLRFTEQTTPGSAGGFTMPLPSAWKEKLAKHVNVPMVLGIRPQGLIECERAKAELVLKTSLVEPLGHETDITAKTAMGSSLVARLTSRPGMKAGDELLVRVDPQACHVFEPGEVGVNLTGRH